MDVLIKRKIEYLLKILQQGENRNNNLSTLVETAIEVIKENCLAFFTTAFNTFVHIIFFFLAESS
jgi:hypothetical protein